MIFINDINYIDSIDFSFTNIEKNNTINKLFNDKETNPFWRIEPEIIDDLKNINVNRYICTTYSHVSWRKIFRESNEIILPDCSYLCLKFSNEIKESIKNIILNIETHFKVDLFISQDDKLGLRIEFLSDYENLHEEMWNFLITKISEI